MTFSIKEDGKRLIFITIAAVLLAFNLKTFVRTGGLFPGGVTGLAVLIQRSAERFFGLELPYTLINVILNALPVYIGLRFIGKKLALYTVYFIFVSSFLTDLIPAIVITYDIMLISVFGGMINGFVVSICLANNANSGGLDFISLYLSERTGLDSFNLILGVNVIILSCAGLLFGWDKALYSIIFQFFSTQVIHLRYRRYQETTLLIVTDFPKEVCHAIQKTSNHSATILHGEGAYEDTERAVVYSVVSSGETKKVISAIRASDQHAFINSIKTEGLSGWFYRRPTE